MAVLKALELLETQVHIERLLLVSKIFFLNFHR